MSLAQQLKQRFLYAVLGCLCLVGCDSPVPPVANQPAAENGQAHEHHHDEPGPHGGHLVDLLPIGAHAEWNHDDENHLITVYLDDFDLEKISEVKFTVEIPDAEPEVFQLTSSDDGWTITSEALLTHLNMGEAANVKLVVVDDTGEQSAKMEAHEHHHH